MADICVIVPVYQVEDYLSKCVESILLQTFGDFLLILVDDGSHDKSGMICDWYAQRDKRIYVIHQKNSGLSTARNAGITYAMKEKECKWISFIDSDDWVHPRYLEYLLEAVTTTGFNISACLFEETAGEPLPEIGRSIEFEAWDTKKYYMASWTLPMTAWGKLFRKEYFINVRFPVGKYHEDEFTVYKVLFRDEKIAVVNLPLYAYYQNPDGIMRRPWFPGRIDATEALKQQVDFFLRKKYKDIAELRFNQLLALNLESQNIIQDNGDTRNGYYKKKLIRQLRRILLKYWRQGWFPFQGSEENKGLYIKTFPEIKKMREIWGSIKGFLNGVFPSRKLGDRISGMWKKR